jgi:hypothetical protein
MFAIVRFAFFLACFSGSLNAIPAGDVTNFTCIEPWLYQIDTTTTRTLLSFLESNVVRVQTILRDHVFQEPEPYSVDPAAMVIQEEYGKPSTFLQERDDELQIASEQYRVIISKKPMLLSITDSNGKTILKETEPVNLSPNSTIQTLQQGEKEQYFGGGMQNGRFTHRDCSIKVQFLFCSAKVINDETNELED